MNKPCPTCPFLEANRDRPTPTDFKCVDQNESEWYSQDNIDGIWRVMRLQPIAFLSCHTTDPDYYGKDNKDNYACLGATLLTYIHYQIYDSVMDYDKYEAIVGRDHALLPRTLAEKAFAMMMGRTDPNWAIMKIAREINIAPELLRLPSGYHKAMEYYNIHIKPHENATTTGTHQT